MEGKKIQEDKERKYCSKLLELAATDDLSGFIHEVEKKGCDIDEASFWYGRSFGSAKMGYEERTPLMIAALYGSMEVLKYILDAKKVDVNGARGSDGATALHCAAAGGSWSMPEVVKLLIDACGDINAVDAEGRRAADLIAPCVRLSSWSKRRRALETLLNGVEGFDEEGERGPAKECKEFPVDVPLPDINAGVYGTDEFRMYSFKVNPCSRAYSHDWTECPFAHPSENARRRDPNKYSYSCVPCPEFKKGSCGKGDACEYAHGVFESWLHPAQYRTRLCKDEISCSRKVCFFAHKPEELRPVYASTGSAIPSPKSLDLTMLVSTAPVMSSPMGGSMRPSVAPPALQLPGSRLKTTLSAREFDLDMELVGLDRIRTQQSLSYGRIGDLKPTNLDNVFGSIDPALLSHSPQFRQKLNQLRSSYPPTVSTSSPARKPSAYGFDSSAAVAAAVMNSRSSAFSKRSQSFIDRSGGANYRPSLSGQSNPPAMMPSKLSDWSAPDGKLDWGFNDEEANKLRKSASFGIRSGNATAPPRRSAGEPDMSLVNSLVRHVPFSGTGAAPDMIHNWMDQMYLEQKQMVA